MAEFVPFLDVKATYLELREDIDAAILRTLGSGNYILGPQVAEFEKAFAEYCKAPYCLGISNGLDALHLCLKAMGVKPGDEVIVPSNTFIATWLAVSYVGATIVPVEPRLDTYNLDPSKIEAAITPKTKVIIPVHLYGQTVEMSPIRAIAEKYGVKILEDAAQSQGATYRGTPAGALGDAAAFSFYPGKNLGAFGDAGAVTTSDKAILTSVLRLRNYGSEIKYEHLERGFNARLDEVQAAILNVKLKVLDSWNERRRRIAARYQTALHGHNSIIAPIVAEHCAPVWHLFVVRTEKRDELSRHFENAKIATMIHYPTPPHKQAAYGKLSEFSNASFPISEKIHREVLSLPIGPSMTDDQVDRVIDAILKFR